MSGTVIALLVVNAFLLLTIAILAWVTLGWE